jgi:hypothetical protein
MKPDPTNLLGMAGIKTPIVGFDDVPDPKPFEPFCAPKRCLFSCYEHWAKGESICLSEGNCSCRGGSYWIGDVEFATRDRFAKNLNEIEGFKSSHELLKQGLDSQKPHIWSMDALWKM